MGSIRFKMHKLFISLFLLLVSIYLALFALKVSTASIVNTAKTLSSNLMTKSLAYENINDAQLESLLLMTVSDSFTRETIFKDYSDPLARITEKNQLIQRLNTVAASTEYVEKIAIFTKQGESYSNKTNFKNQGVELPDISKYIDISKFKTQKEYINASQSPSEIFWFSYDIDGTRSLGLVKTIINSKTFQPDAVIIFILNNSYILNAYSNLKFGASPVNFIYDFDNKLIKTSTNSNENDYISEIQLAKSMLSPDKKNSTNNSIRSMSTAQYIINTGISKNNLQLISILPIKSLTQGLQTLKICIFAILIMFSIILLLWSFK